MRFRIEWVERERGHVLAAQLDPGEFEVDETSTLGGLAIQPYLSQPRALDEAGRPRFDLFVFTLRRRGLARELVQGEIVELARVVGQTDSEAGGA